MFQNETSASKSFRKGDLTEGNIVRNIILFALPLVAGQILQNLYNSVDSIVVGKYVSTTALAAVTSCSDISQLLVNFFTGLSVGSGVTFSRSFGNKDYSSFHRSTHTALCFSVMIGIVMAVLGILAGPFLLSIVACPADVYPEALLYLRICLIGILFTSIYNVQAGILRSAGNSSTPFIILCITCFCNIILDVSFVVVLRMGVAGVAAATIISQLISVFITTIQMIRTPYAYKLILRDLKIDRILLAEILYQGIPAAIQSCLITFSNLFIQRYINGFGTHAMAGSGIGKKVDNYVGMITISIAHSTTTYVSQCVGANKYDRAFKGIRYVIYLNIAIIVIVAVPIYIFAEGITTWFSNDPKAQYYAVMMIHTFMPLYVLQAFHQILSNAIRGFGKSTVAMITTMTGLIVCRQIYVAAAMSISHNIRLVFLSWPVGWVFSALFSFLYYWPAIRCKRSY